MRALNLDILRFGLPGITPANGAFLMEAAVFGLVSSGHRSGVHLKISGDFAEDFSLQWTHETDLHTQASWTVSNEMVEFGAVGLAILIIKELTTFDTFEKGQLLTGIDYWLGAGGLEHKSLPLFSRKARLEITGIEKETRQNGIEKRLNIKIKQVSKTDYSSLPVYIIAVEFGQPQAKIIVK